MYEVYGTNTKKMLNMLILEILEVFSDENHPLTQQEILRLLKSEYGVEKCDRRSVKANVLSLIDMGYEISMDERHGYYLIQRDFDDEELRWLIDAVLFSKTITGAQAERLIGKLEGFGNKYFESKVSHVSTTPNIPRTKNVQSMINVNLINDAIDKKKKITFRYNSYGVDLKLHDRGKQYVANPYQMIAANGFYYLLSNVDSHDDIAYFRIDKMSSVEILEDKAKPVSKVQGLEGGLNLPKHMAEHVYMFEGDSKLVTFKCNVQAVDAAVDWFGQGLKVINKDEEQGVVKLQVKCNLNAMKYWALQYGMAVEVLEPKQLRDEIKEALTAISKKYNDTCID